MRCHALFSPSAAMRSVTAGRGEANHLDQQSRCRASCSPKHAIHPRSEREGGPVPGSAPDVPELRSRPERTTYAVALASRPLIVASPTGFVEFLGHTTLVDIAAGRDARKGARGQLERLDGRAGPRSGIRGNPPPEPGTSRASSGSLSYPNWRIQHPSQHD